ncbi:MAG: outer membrane beta-barrel protein [Candidatus Krumholzibacteriia bacterium]
MRKVHVVGLAVLVLVAQLLATPALAGSHAHSRNGFLLGLGLGWGNAGAEVQGLNPDRANSGSGNFRLGWALNDRVTIGLENTAWIKDFEIAGTTADLRMTGTVTAFAVTVFPHNMGFYLRGGIGVATGAAKITSGNFTFDGTETGFGALASFGYEWRLAAKFALGPQFQYAYLNIDGDGTNSVDFVSLTGQATWYW